VHAHTTWSDGQLALGEVVDLYGRSGFDVLCITTMRFAWTTRCRPQSIRGPGRPTRTSVRAEAARAARDYGLIVLLGLELTDNHPDPDRSAHALALGLEHFVSIESGLVEALEEANDQEAVVVAAHPYADHDRSPLRPTRRIWRERESFRGLIHRYELFNRRETFAWVAEDGLPPLATATSIVRSTCRPGRPSSAARRTPTRSWIASARTPGSI
jgi:Histidinol phosphatase and related hydrolases of the PHP family